MNTERKARVINIWRFLAGYTLCGFVAAFVGANARSDQTNQIPQFVEIKAVQTETLNGFCLGLYGRQSADFTNDTSVDDELVLVAWTTNAPAWFLIPAEPEYAYQVELFDANGVAVPRTETGKRVGRKFFNFGNAPSKEGIRTKQMRADKKGQPAAMPILFRPRDYFKIDKPGRYTLQIRFQILTFPENRLNRDDNTNGLIRFPPLNYPLVKRATMAK
jgi:hypothetical protein